MHLPIPQQVTLADLLELLEGYGATKHIFFPTDWKIDKALGFALVEMSVLSNGGAGAIRPTLTYIWPSVRYMKNLLAYRCYNRD
ncbi:MAG: RNA-binding protein [Chroococcidiopsidaceae cyanobacterium CP_BM_ER_R8_30]|nr:RNA-binding protein [Chroococcidiopsidaceae cyanobacterium CP_BM_ER_R8_30]